VAALTQTFESAPMGGRVVRQMVLAVVLVGLIVIFESGVAYHTAVVKGIPLIRMWPAIAAAVIAFGVMGGKFVCDRNTTAQFKIIDNVLVTGKKSYPLTGLTDISRNREIMSWAVRMLGKGGLGAIRGRYWSLRSGGMFDAFLTDTEYAVVLRWPKNAVAVSPADPELFIHTVRKAVDVP